MINLWIYIKIFTIIFILSFFGKVSASTWVTIVELKQNIVILQEKQKEIYEKTPDLSSVSDIKIFLKDDLTIDQINEIKKIILDYNDFKTNNINIEDYQNQLLFVKKETYKKLTVYVKNEKLDKFLNYIRDNLETIKQDNLIKDEISKNKEILEEKIDTIKIKIKENKDESENNINDIINIKVDEKIKIIKENKDFQKLALEKRKYIITQVVKKIELKKSKKEKTWNQLNERELYIYDIVIEKLNLFLKELK